MKLSRKVPFIWRKPVLSRRVLCTWANFSPYKGPFIFYQVGGALVGFEGERRGKKYALKGASKEEIVG